jgi:hypothetical protein
MNKKTISKNLKIARCANVFKAKQINIVHQYLVFQSKTEKNIKMSQTFICNLSLY